MGWPPCPNCCEEGCPVDNCLNGIGPDQVLLNVNSAFSEGSCGSCTSLNDEFILDCDETPLPADPPQWLYTFPSAVCSVKYLTLRISALFSGVGVSWWDDTADFSSWNSTGLLYHISCFDTNTEGDHPCNTWNNTELTTEMSPVINSILCNFTVPQGPQNTDLFLTAL